MTGGQAATDSRFVRALRAADGDGDRARLIAAMALALRTRPLPAITVQDVLDRAPGVERAAFARHFARGVADCYLATYEASAALLRAQTAEAVVVTGAERPYEERIALGVRAYLETLASEPGLARAFLRDVHAAGPEALARRRQVTGGFAQMIQALAEQHADELPPGYAVHPDMARALVEALEELTLHSIDGDRVADLPRLTDTATRMVHAALVAGA